MFIAEAKWVGNQVRSLQFASQPIRCLNLGSSTRAYREISQPHVYQQIFEPLLKIADVTHVDMKAADGVDIAGDFMDEEFWQKIPERAFSLVMCCNLLTHITDPKRMYALIRRSVAPRGYLVITTPQLYPYCADPLDSKYRPSKEDILKNFKSFEIIAGTKICLEETHLSRLLKSPKLIISLVANIFLPVKGFIRWRAVITDIPNILKPLSTVCLILRAP
jgi:SAM-dependent methyltransferase